MLFLSTYENKIDSKGRISVPAPYRTVLDQMGQQLIVTRSLTDACLEGQGVERINRIVEALDTMDSLADETKILQTMLSSARPVKTDSEGRILLPEDFLAFANITETVVFAGVGRLFRMWNPETWNAHETDQRRLVKEGGLPPLILNPQNNNQNNSPINNPMPTDKDKS